MHGVSTSCASWPAQTVSRRLLLIIAGLVLIAAAAGAKTPTWTPDSAGYVDGYILRPALIPLVFRALECFFSRSASLRVFDSIQASAAAATCCALILALHRHLRLTPATTVIVGAVLSLPQWQAVTSIMSESLAYSFLCAFVLFSLPALWGERSRPALIGAMASCAALILTRAQFVFLLPLVLIAVARQVLGEKAWIERGKTLGCVAFVAAAAIALQGAHTYPKLGTLAGVPVTGVQAMTVAIAISNEQDVAMIPDPPTRALAQRVRARVEAEGLLVAQSGTLTPAVHFGASYNAILNIIYDEYFDGTPHRTRDERALSPQLWSDMDRAALGASRGIARHAWPRITAFCAASIFAWTRYTLVLAAGLFALGALSYRTNRNWATLALFASGMWFANVFLVTALEPPQMRYTFYFDTLVVAVSLAFASRSLSASAPPID